MPAFITRRKVEFAQTDMAGIVHFANYYRWMEEAEHDFFRSHGLKVMERQPDGTVYIGWPRVSCSCQYEAPAHYEDELELHVRVERVGFKSVTFLHEIHTGGRRIANGRMKIACCLCRSDGTLTAIEIPEEYRTAFESVAEPAKSIS
jgi:acyl-CoA thioester hydrolase